MKTECVSCAILRGVRERIGAAAIVGYRMGVEEFTDGGLDIEQTLEIARKLCDDGLIDYLSLAQGNFNSIETHLPDRHWPILAYRQLHARFKSVANGVPVVASTRIQRPEQAESVLAAGEAELIGLCRALIVDPEWPIKASTGRAEKIFATVSPATNVGPRSLPASRSPACRTRWLAENISGPS